MGGMKKKSMSSSGKGSQNTSNDDKVKKTETKKSTSKTLPKQKLSVIVEEPVGMKAIKGMKAITTQSLSRAIGVKISVANAFLRSLEAKGMIRNIGGYSGHRIYEFSGTNIV
jgi:small subunit ribosomal protein S25e